MNTVAVSTSTAESNLSNNTAQAQTTLIDSDISIAGIVYFDQDWDHIYSSLS